MSIFRVQTQAVFSFDASKHILNIGKIDLGFTKTAKVGQVVSEDVLEGKDTGFDAFTIPG